MASFTNPAKGLRGILLKDGSTILIEAGGSAEIDGRAIAKAHPDLVKADDKKGSSPAP